MLWFHQGIKSLVKTDTLGFSHLPVIGSICLGPSFQPMSLWGDNSYLNHHILPCFPKAHVHLTMQNVFSLSPGVPEVWTILTLLKVQLQSLLWDASYILSVYNTPTPKGNINRRILRKDYIKTRSKPAQKTLFHVHDLRHMFQDTSFKGLGKPHFLSLTSCNPCDLSTGLALLIAFSFP
jgi:hypothetical protein